MNLRALLKNHLFELLSEMFLEWLEMHEQAKQWTKQQCPQCHKPYSFADAQFCAFCGTPLQQSKNTEPILCSVQFPTQSLNQSTAPLNLPTGTLARLHHREKVDDVGPHTQVLRTLSKIQLQKGDLL